MENEVIRAIFLDEERLNAIFRSDKNTLSEILKNEGFLSTLFDPRQPRLFATLLDRMADIEQWDFEKTLNLINGREDAYGDTGTLRSWLSDDQGQWNADAMETLVNNPALAYRLQVDKANIFNALLEKGEKVFAQDRMVMRKLMPLLLARKHEQGVAQFGGEGEFRSSFWSRVYADGEALIQAVNDSDVNAVVELLQKSHAIYFIDNKNETVNTPLINAAAQGNRDIALLLIEKGAKLDEKGYYDRTALMFAAMKGHADIVESLITNKAKLDEQSRDGNTALIYAAAYGHNRVAKLLLEAGADLDKKTDSYTTALQAALGGSHYDIADMIREEQKARKKAKRLDRWLDRISKFGEHITHQL